MPVRVLSMDRTDWQRSVLAIQNDPPGTPAKGDRYIVGASPTGAWSGEADNIAEWDGSAWLFVAVSNGFKCFVHGESAFYDFDTSWAPSTDRAVTAIKADEDWNAGNWDTAFSWGDHASAGYALTANLGSLATKDPGGTANQLQVNDGSGGLAGIPVTFEEDVLDSSSAIRATGSAARTSGVGVEILYTTVGRIFAYDRTLGEWRDLEIGVSGNQFRLNADGSVLLDAPVTVGNPAGTTPAGFVNAEGVQVDGVDVLKVGDFGVGNTGIPTNLDSVTDIRTQPSGFYRVGSIASDFSATFGVEAGPLFLASFNNDRAAGLMVRATEANRAAFIFGQSTAGDQWGEELWHSGNLPVTVSGDDIGLGVSPTERLDVNGNARVRGNIIADNATGHTIGGKDFQYDTETVTLGGDFDSGQQVKCVRIGDQVTVTGASSALSHNTKSAPASALSGYLPGKYRPPFAVDNIYHIDSDGSAMLRVSSSGQFQLVYRNHSGALMTRSNSIVIPSITYNV